MKVFILVMTDHEYGGGADTRVYMTEALAYKDAGAYMQDQLKSEFQHYLREDFKAERPELNEWYCAVTSLLARDDVEGALNRFNDLEGNEKFEVSVQEREVLT